MMSAGLVLIAYNLFYVLCTILLCIGICIDFCFVIIKIVLKQLITFFVSLLLSAPFQVSQCLPCKNTQHWRLQRLRLIFLLIATWQCAARYNTNAFV